MTTEIIAIVALFLSAINTLLWILFLITIRKLTSRFKPLFDNLTQFPVFDRMEVPSSNLPK